MADTMSITFPMLSHFLGFNDEGKALFDRAIGSQELAAFDKEIYRDGIFPTNSSHYQATVDGGMNIRVKAGKAYIQGRKTMLAEDVILTLDEQSGGNRTDLIALQLNLNDDVRDVLVIVKKGDLSLVRTSTIHEKAIATVLVRNNATTILQSDITDLRLDPEKFGITANEFIDFDTSALYAQIRDMTSQEQATWEAQIAAQREDYETWKTTIDGWKNLTITELATVVTFNFENQFAYPGTYKTFSDTEDTITEELRRTVGDGLFARQVTTFVADGSIEVVQTVYNPDDTVFWNMKAITTFPGGNPRTEVISL